MMLNIVSPNSTLKTLKINKTNPVIIEPMQNKQKIVSLNTIVTSAFNA